jgi:hypothetical protein
VRLRRAARARDEGGGRATDAPVLPDGPEVLTPEASSAESPADSVSSTTAVARSSCRPRARARQLRRHHGSPRPRIGVPALALPSYRSCRQLPNSHRIIMVSALAHATL